MPSIRIRRTRRRHLRPINVRECLFPGSALRRQCARAPFATLAVDFHFCPSRSVTLHALQGKFNFPSTERRFYNSRAEQLLRLPERLLRGRVTTSDRISRAERRDACNAGYYITRVN